MFEDSWIDTHCHIHDMDNSDAIYERSKTDGVSPVVCIGTDARTSLLASQMSAQHPNSIYYSIGLHPHEGTTGLDEVIALAYECDRNKESRFVAIGECGLDYYYEHSPRDAQRQSFLKQIILADELDKTLAVHTRDAWDDTLDMLRSESKSSRTVIHCFTGGVEEARKCLDLGFYLSFSGVVTFKKSLELQEAAKFCPLDRMLLETDSPFLAPVPVRGSTNEPRNIPLIGQFISDLKEIGIEELRSTISTTSKRVFSLQ